jgi:hypothetical protein
MGGVVCAIPDLRAVGSALLRPRLRAVGSFGRAGQAAHSTVVHGCAIVHAAEARPPRRPDHQKLAHEWSESVCQSAQPPADRAVQRLRPRRHRIAPASRWAARPRSGLQSARQRAHTNATPCLTSSPPGGAHGRHRRRCTLPVLLVPVTPIPLMRGCCGSLPFLKGRGCAAPDDACGGSPRRPGLPLHTVSLPHSRCGLSSLPGRLHFDAPVRTMLSHPGVQAPRPQVLVPAVCSHLCLALP